MKKIIFLIEPMKCYTYQLRFLLIVIISTFFNLKTFATHAPIFYNGKAYVTFSNPLESFLEKHPDRLPKYEGPISTSFMRGYIGVAYEVTNNQLFVKDIQIPFEDETRSGWKSVVNEVFPDQKEVKVDWFTGLLVIPYSIDEDYTHYLNYKNYFLLEISKGDVITTKQFDYDGFEAFKDRQFLAFKQTEEYKKLKVGLMQKNESQNDKTRSEADIKIDKEIRYNIIFYLSKILTD